MREIVSTSDSIYSNFLLFCLPFWFYFVSNFLSQNSQLWQLLSSLKIYFLETFRSVKAHKLKFFSLAQNFLLLFESSKLSQLFS